MVHASSSGNARSICARWRSVAGSEDSSTPKPKQCIHAATPAIRPTEITSEISSTSFGGPCETLSGQLPLRSRPVLVHLIAVVLAAQLPSTSRLSLRWSCTTHLLPLHLAAQLTSRLDVIGGHRDLDWTLCAGPSVFDGSSYPLRSPLVDAVAASGASALQPRPRLCLRLVSPTFPSTLCKCRRFAPGCRVNDVNGVCMTRRAVLTSERGGPGVWMRKPSSPYAWRVVSKTCGLASSLVVWSRTSHVNGRTVASGPRSAQQ